MLQWVLLSPSSLAPLQAENYAESSKDNAKLAAKDAAISVECTTKGAKNCAGVCRRRGG